MLVQRCFDFADSAPKSHEKMLLVVFTLGTVALSRSASSAASLMSGFGQLLRQAPTGSVFTLLTLSKDSTINVRFHPSSLIPEYSLGNLFLAPTPNAAGAVTYHALSCLFCEIVQIKRHTEDINRSRCEQHLMCDSTFEVLRSFGFHGHPT